MPTYDYSCDKCGLKFERLESIKSEPLQVCPRDELGCPGEGNVHRIISKGNASFVLFGGGWASDGYSKSSENKNDSHSTFDEMINIEHLQNSLRISYFNSEGGITLNTIEIPTTEMFEWVPTNSQAKADKVYRNYDHSLVTKKKSNYLSKYRIQEFLSTLPDETIDAIFGYTMPKKFYIDIETAFEDEFPDPKIAKYPVLSLAFVSSANDTITVLGTKDMSKKDSQYIEDNLNEHFKDFNHKVTFKYIKFDSEFDMLYSFFAKAIQKMSCITGWNFINFDWTYLVNRANRLDINVDMSSPVGKMKEVYRYGVSLPLHRLIVDYMEIYDKYDRFVKLKESLSLNVVSRQVLGIQKVNYNGSLMDLYESSYRDYIFYNAADTFLVKLIDEKINTIETFLRLGSITRVETLDVMSPVKTTENMLAKHLFRDKKLVIVDDRKRNVKSEKFQGAYVKEPEIGYYRDIALNDFMSLYPTTMRMYNISPEMFLGMTDEAYDEKSNEYIITTVNGAMFDAKSDGATRIFVKELHNSRQEAKKEAKDIGKVIATLKKVHKKRFG